MSGATMGSGAPRRVLPLRSTARRPHTNRDAHLTKPPPPPIQLEFLIHELTGTCKRETAEVIATLADFGIPLEEQRYGSRIYRRRWQGMHAVTVQADNKMGSDEVHVRIPGQACEALGLVNLLSLATLLDLKTTRLDGAVDYCPFTPRHLLEAHLRGLVRTHSQTQEWDSSPTGDTFGLGSGRSDASLRCYDRRGYTRTEFQLRRGHAQEFLARLFSSHEDEHPALFLGAIRAIVDFVDATQDENISRCDLLPFWSDFVGMFQAIRLAPARALATARTYRDRARKQMAAMFYTYVASSILDLDMNWMQVVGELYQYGARQAKTRHRMLLSHGVVTMDQRGARAALPYFWYPSRPQGATQPAMF